MTTEQIFVNVRKIVADHFECYEDEVTMQTRLGDDLGADSLDYVEMVIDVEQKFNIVVPDELTYFNPSVTIQEYCKGIKELISNK